MASNKKSDLIGSQMDASRRSKAMLSPASLIRLGALTCACIPVVVAAQSDVKVHGFSTQPPDGRFEIVQSPLAAKWTFRLDRHTGQVDQLVSSLFGGVAWQEMPAIGLPKTTNVGDPRFVLFTSGLAARHTFLIDTETGDSWILTAWPSDEEDSDEVAGWAPFDE